MSAKQQTAVEWFYNQILKGEFINDPDELLRQAKELENNQSVNFAKWYHWKKEAGEISDGRFTNKEIVEMYNNEIK